MVIANMPPAPSMTATCACGEVEVNRVVATCCNSAMFVNFDRGPHWVSAYRARFHGDPPPLQARICTKFKPDGVVLVDDVPSYNRFPPSFIIKLLASRVAMALGR